MDDGILVRRGAAGVGASGEAFPEEAICAECAEFFERFSCGAGVGEGECDCPVCQGYCVCDEVEGGEDGLEEHDGQPDERQEWQDLPWGGDDQPYECGAEDF